MIEFADVMLPVAVDGRLRDYDSASGTPRDQADGSPLICQLFAVNPWPDRGVQ